MDVAPGTRVGRYTVETLLGRGGMASVFRVRHDELGTHYALKLLDMTSPIVRERLLEEGRTQSRLRHPNVVSVFDVVVHESCPGLVMEYVDGPSMHLLIHAEPDIPAPVRDALVTGTVYGVRAAHKVGVVHRDLKPANILLARTDEQLVPKVADFGLAKAVDAEGPSRRTRTGTFLGTPVYMAPEQVRNARDVDERADIYSLGAIFYELVTRRLPVDSEDIIELFARIVKRDYPRPRELVPDLPEWQDEAIWSALDPDPSRRIPDCDTLLAVWRGKIRFEPDNTPNIERTSPFDLAFLRRTAKLGAGDGVEAAPAPAAVPAPAVTVPRKDPNDDTTERLEPPRAITPARSVAAGNGTTAAVVLGGAGAVAILGGALLLVVLIAALAWVWRAGPPPAEPVPVAAPEPPPMAPRPAPPPVVVAPTPAPPPVRPAPRPPRPAPPAASGSVVVRGDATQVWLVGEGRRVKPSGDVPKGVYQVEAIFPGRGTVQTPLSVAVLTGETVVIECVSGFATCKVVPR